MDPWFAALGWVVELVKPLLANLKPKSSSEKARSYAYALFHYLGVIEEKSEAFVNELGVLIQRVESGQFESNDKTVWRAREALRNLASSLNSLTEAIEEIDPQLRVHLPEVAREIATATQNRAYVVSSAEEALSHLEDVDPEVLAEIRDQALQNLEQIQAATKEFREFLATQFSFKESF